MRTKPAPGVIHAFCLRIFSSIVTFLAVAAWLMIGTDDTAQVFTTLHSFALDANPLGTNNEGANPAARLVVVGNGGLLGYTFYGSGAYGGTNGNGAIFKVRSSGSAYGTLHHFAAGDYDVFGNFTNSEGAQPGALLIQSLFLNAALYGVANNGGLYGSGTLFKMNTNGASFTVFHTFTANDGANTDGYFPNSLVLAGSTLFGSAAGGGNGSGTLFKINTDGTGFSAFYTFDALQSDPYYHFSYNSSGSGPNSLVQAGDMLYGTAKDGGINGYGGAVYGGGTLFAINTNGTGFTVLHYFSVSSNGTNSDGLNPNSVYVSGSMLYGTTAAGGTMGNGTIFAVGTNGAGFATLHNFPPTANVSPYTNSDGTAPTFVMRAGDTLFGTAPSGGLLGHGVIFELQTNGTGFLNFYNFTVPNVEDNIYNGTDFMANTNSDGFDPAGGLVVAGNLLYGTAFGGGTGGSGTIFSITEPPTSPIPLNIRLAGSSVILTWTNAAFGLQAAPTLTGTYTNIPNASSPYTNALSGAEEFFRLLAP